VKKQPDHINDDLLVKYLLDITTPQEKTAVAAWLEEKQEHRQYFEHFRLIWEESKKLAKVSNVDEDDAWSRFQQRVGANGHSARIVRLDTRPDRARFLRIAAILVVLLGAAGFWYFSQVRTTPMMVSSGRKVVNETLPDGSRVTLNKQSTIVYAASFKKERSIKLEGEAFFDVARDPAKPFVIAVNGVTVKVLGTSFNVKSTAGKTEVIVETGAVEVTSNHKSIRLQQHEKAVVTGNREAPSKQANTDELYNYYRTRTFVCNNTPLWKLVGILNEAYGVNIVIANNGKRDLQINATFTNNSLDSTLNVIGLTYEITVEKQGSQIILK
jgi:ferric-dicitrate binding protein FerR (iron transport regulator)